MFSLILAAEVANEVAATSAPGDDYVTASLVLLGIGMLVTAIATWRVTPRAEHH
jgi:hypothetical protein